MIEAAKKAGHHLSMTQSEWVAKVFLALVVLAIIWMCWRFIKRALGGGSSASQGKSRPRSYTSWR